MRFIEDRRFVNNYIMFVLFKIAHGGISINFFADLKTIRFND